MSHQNINYLSEKGIATNMFTNDDRKMKKKCLHKGDKCGALLTDLSRAFDCLLHEFLIAELHAFGFGTNYYSLLTVILKKEKLDNEYSESINTWTTTR